MADKSARMSDELDDLADIPSGAMVILKVTDPASLLAHLYAAALMSEMSGVRSLGFSGGMIGVVGSSIGKFGGVGGIASEGDVGGAKPLCGAERKVIRPEDQSINGLCCFSQLKPRTAEQEESSEVT
jgi:hypothetical protein